MSNTAEPVFKNSFSIIYICETTGSKFLPLSLQVGESIPLKNSKDILPSGEFDRLILCDDIFGPLITLHKYLQGEEMTFAFENIRTHSM